MCLSHTLSEIEHQKRELRKVRVFEVQVCRTCGHFQKDTDFCDVIGVSVVETIFQRLQVGAVGRSPDDLDRKVEGFVGSGAMTGHDREQLLGVPLEVPVG